MSDELLEEYRQKGIDTLRGPKPKPEHQISILELAKPLSYSSLARAAFRQYTDILQPYLMLPFLLLGMLSPFYEGAKAALFQTLESYPAAWVLLCVSMGVVVGLPLWRIGMGLRARWWVRVLPKLLPYRLRGWEAISTHPSLDKRRYWSTLEGHPQLTDLVADAELLTIALHTETDDLAVNQALVGALVVLGERLDRANSAGKHSDSPFYLAPFEVLPAKKGKPIVGKATLKGYPGTYAKTLLILLRFLLFDLAKLQRATGAVSQVIVATTPGNPFFPTLDMKKGA